LSATKVAFAGQDGPMTDNLKGLLGTHGRGVLATIRRNGRPQLSNVDFSYDAAAWLIRVSTTADRAKVANLRRDPRVSVYVPSDGLATYVVAEGEASLSAVAEHVDDAAVEELVEVYREVQGEHPDWDDYRRAMVEDERVVIRVRVDRFYGFAL
jgi:PPOX class probable F420-dependent enzyme